MDSLRRSVRVRAQGGEAVSIMTKAQTRAQNRYNLRSSGSGNALLKNFPYSRLTIQEIDSLFWAYQIKLGRDDLSMSSIIQAIKSLDRVDFDILINQAIHALKRQSDSSRCLILDQDDSGVLTIL